MSIINQEQGGCNIQPAFYNQEKKMMSQTCVNPVAAALPPRKDSILESYAKSIRASSRAAKSPRETPKVSLDLGNYKQGTPQAYQDSTYTRNTAQRIPRCRTAQGSINQSGMLSLTSPNHQDSSY